MGSKNTTPERASLRVEKLVIATSDDFKAVVVCPRCEGKNIVSDGARWLCKDCGRQFNKIYIPKKLLPAPPCPYCKGRMINKGVDYTCTECGKWMTKHLISNTQP